MTMTHKEAVDKASRYAAMIPIPDAEDLTEFLHTYVEASGLVLVPKTLPEDGPLRGAVCDYTPWPAALWDAMLAAAPDPFEEGE